MERGRGRGGEAGRERIKGEEKVGRQEEKELKGEEKRERGRERMRGRGEKRERGEERQREIKALHLLHKGTLHNVIGIKHIRFSSLNLKKKKS